MGETGAPKTASRIAVGKDLVALLRDAALFVLGFLLIAFPGTFNTILVNAGFEEGSIVGFKWKSGLLESDKALKDAQQAIANLQTKNDQLVEALSEAKAKAGDSPFGQRIDKLENENRNLRDNSQRVQESLSQTINANAPLVEKARPPGAAASPSDFTVGLNTVGVADDQRRALTDLLRSRGYAIDSEPLSYPAGERPTWFAQRPTVFYYAASALPTARDVASILKAATGVDFTVQKGGGLGVDPARRDVTIYVNYAKP